MEKTACYNFANFVHFWKYF